MLGEAPPSKHRNSASRARGGASREESHPGRVSLREPCRGSAPLTLGGKRGFGQTRQGHRGGGAFQATLRMFGCVFSAREKHPHARNRVLPPVSGHGGLLCRVGWRGDPPWRHLGDCGPRPAEVWGYGVAV